MPGVVKQSEGPRLFSLTEGGPFYRLLVRLRIRTPEHMKRAWWLGVLLWLPIVTIEGVVTALGFPTDPLIFDASLHVRLLFALPIMLFAERMLDQNAASAIKTLYVGRYCDPVALARIAARAERLRDLWQVELVLLAAAVIGGQLALWGVFGAAGWVHGGTPGGSWALPRIWYGTVALPIVQFVMFRWMWRWIIWSYVLVDLARQDLALLSTHPDHASGLSSIARPVPAFSGFVLAISSMLAGAWGTRLWSGHTTLPALLPEVITLLLGALAVAVAPLLLFSGKLYRARRLTIADYSDFSRRYVASFHRRWIAPGGSPQPPLGSPDIQSLADLGFAYGVVSKTRVFVFSARNVLSVWFAALLPLVPLIAHELTLDIVLKKIVATVLGGLPL